MNTDGRWALPSSILLCGGVRSVALAQSLGSGHFSALLRVDALSRPAQTREHGSSGFKVTTDDAVLTYPICWSKKSRKRFL